MLPAEAEVLLATVQRKHEERKAASSVVTARERQRSPVIDDKHQQFISDLVSVSALTYCWSLLMDARCVHTQSQRILNVVLRRTDEIL